MCQMYFFTSVQRKYVHSEIKNFDNITRITALVNYVVLSLMVIILVEVVLISFYHIILLLLITTLSYGWAVVLFAVFSRNLLKWFRMRRTFILLIFGIASCLIMFSIAITLVYFQSKLIDKILSIEDSAYLSLSSTISLSNGTNTFEIKNNFDTPHIPESKPDNISNSSYLWVYNIKDIKNFSIDIYFALIWVATSLLLLHNVKRIGFFRYWLIVSMAFLYYLFAILPITDTFVQLFMNDDYRVAILLDTYSTPVIGLFASIGLWSIARSIKINHDVKNFMTISAIGFFLFFLTGEAAVFQTSFPPFGIINISLFFVSCYLLITGLSITALSISKDSELRKYIRNSTLSRIKLLENMSDAEMEKEINNKVIEALQRSEIINSQYPSSLSSSMTQMEIKKYIEELLEERVKSSD